MKLPLRPLAQSLASRADSTDAGGAVTLAQRREKAGFDASRIGGHRLPAGGRSGHSPELAIRSHARQRNLGMTCSDTRGAL